MGFFPDIGGTLGGPDPQVLEQLDRRIHNIIDQSQDMLQRMDRKNREWQDRSRFLYDTLQHVSQNNRNPTPEDLINQARDLRPAEIGDRNSQHIREILNRGPMGVRQFDKAEVEKALIEIFGTRFAVAKYSVIQDRAFSTLPDVAAMILAQDRLRSDAELINRPQDKLEVGMEEVIRDAALRYEKAVRDVPDEEGLKVNDMYDARDQAERRFDPPFEEVRNWVRERGIFEWKR